jgi:hypothetical protein
MENRVLRKIIEPKRGDITEDWKKQNSEVIQDLYAAPNIIQVIKSRGMR